MLLLYWLPSVIVPTLFMLPAASVAGTLAGSPAPAPVGSLQGDLE
jgi:hypothetical protein